MLLECLRMVNGLAVSLMTTTFATSALRLRGRVDTCAKRPPRQERQLRQACDA